MPKWDPDTLTERQRKWFASVREGLERDTGRPLEAWAEIARGCPETGHRARLKWMKEIHGLAQNRASQVLSAAFGEDAPGDAGDADPLWSDPRALQVFEAIRAAVETLPEVLVGRRKGYSPFSRRVQFAAARPLKDGRIRLGLALPPEADARLSPPGRESWSERLTAVIELASPAEVDAAVTALLRQAWDRS
jgi:Domain of unknown function (DUF5655)/Domain of unknown function (DUF4287)